jgi:hypothetical protein
MSRLLLALLLCSGTALAQAPDEDDIDPMPPPPPQYIPMPVTPQPMQPPPQVMYQYQAPPAPVSRVDVGLRAGAAARSLYDVGFGGLQLGLDIGKEGPHGAWSFTMDLLLGRSSEGLTTGHGQLGFLGEAKLGRLRVGGGARIGVFGVQRITNAQFMSLLTFGPRFVMSYDLVQFGNGGAFLLGADLGFDLVLADNPLMFDGNLFLGFRL